jgi:hypothetical protein
MLPTLLLLATTASPVHAGEFMDTWVSLAFEDDNVLAGPEYKSPAANFVMRGNRTFFEDYESRYSDDITQSHLVLYRRDEGFWKDWYTEAALVMQWTPYVEADESHPGVDLRDDGSYVRLVRKLGGSEDDTFSITGYAVDASRFRLGYSYDLSWGGREIFIKDPGASPGVRLQYQRGGSYLFAGAKTAIQAKEIEGEDATDSDKRNESYYGLLAGGGIELAEKFKIEAGFGSFQQGQLTSMNEAAAPLFGEPISAMGVAGQLAWRSTTELDFIQSSELRLYRNSPDYVKDSYIAHDQLDGFGMLVQAELNWLTHNLLNAEKTGSTVLENAMAGDVQSKFVFGSTTLGVDFVYKDLAYIVFNVPGTTSGMSTSEAMNPTPQLYGRIKASHYLEDARMTPYAGAGLMQPATYEAQGVTVVQVNEREIMPLPDGRDAVNILGALAGVEVDASKSVVLVGEVLYTANQNITDYVQNEQTEEWERVTADAKETNALGFNIIMRARF